MNQPGKILIVLEWFIKQKCETEKFLAVDSECR